jgi:hypothetical protein
MVQVQFERKVNGGVRHTTAWVDASWRLKRGNVVTFDHEESLMNERRWTVVRVGKIEQEYAQINDKWRVGGLS